MTYPVFLLAAILGLADADAVTGVADGLVRARLDRLAAHEGDIAADLRRHWRQGQLAWSRHWLVRLLLDVREAAERCDRQLKRVSRGLRHRLSLIRLLSCVARRLGLQ